MNKPTDFLVYESAMTRAERTIRRLWVLCLVLIFALLGTNACWLWYEKQWEYAQETTITQEAENGVNNYIGNDGDISNGEANDKNSEE